jgi:hypothetical protein
MYARCSFTLPDENDQNLTSEEWFMTVARSTTHPVGDAIGTVASSSRSS